MTQDASTASNDSPVRVWMPRDRWNALVSGEDCPACAEVTGHGLDNSEGYFVTDLGVSRLRLQREQHVPGWCVLLLRRHVREPHELPAEERIAFFEDMVRVGRALEQVYAAQKINYSILGNIVPHLHAQVDDGRERPVPAFVGQVPRVGPKANIRQAQLRHDRVCG